LKRQCPNKSGRRTHHSDGVQHHKHCYVLCRAGRPIIARRKFSIRDLIWLTLLVALAVAWWLDHRAASRREQVLRLQVELETQLRMTEQYRNALESAREAELQSRLEAYKATLERASGRNP
jgi:hypothetical protein